MSADDDNGPFWHMAPWLLTGALIWVTGWHSTGTINEQHAVWRCASAWDTEVGHTFPNITHIDIDDNDEPEDADGPNANEQCIANARDDLELEGVGAGILAIWFFRRWRKTLRADKERYALASAAREETAARRQRPPDAD